MVKAVLPQEAEKVQPFEEDNVSIDYAEVVVDEVEERKGESDPSVREMDDLPPSLKAHRSSF